jgi:hypothetical protein
MKIGIIGATHDNVHAIEKAVRLFNLKNVELVIHVGDYSSGFTAKYFKPLNAKIIGIFGENDGDREELKREFKKIGAEIYGEFRVLEVKGKRIAIIHGKYPELVKSLVDSNNFDVVAYGHDHRAKITKLGRTIAVNPGGACGYLEKKRTIAIVNLKDMSAEVVEF